MRFSSWNPERQTVDSLHLYNMTVVVPLRLHIQRLRCDKGGEYISKEFKILCVNSAISRECTATATPQHNGASGCVGRTLATTARCLLKDGTFPSNMWSELFFTAVYLTNRSSHSALGGRTPFFKMHGKEADLSTLRAIGSRAFVHIEPHTPKLGDKAWRANSAGSARPAELIASTTRRMGLWSKAATSHCRRQLHTRCHQWELITRWMKTTKAMSPTLPPFRASLSWTHERRISTLNLSAFERGSGVWYKQRPPSKNQRLYRKKRHHPWRRKMLSSSSPEEEKASSPKEEPSKDPGARIYCI